MERRIVFALMALLFTGALALGCGDGDANGLAIEASNTGTGDFDLSVGTFDEPQIFCYEDSGCETAGWGFATVFEGQSWIVEQSEPDRTATGIRIVVEVEAGEGELRLVEGQSYSDDGWEEFNIDATLESSGPVSEGDVITLEWGEVDQ